VYSLSGIPQGVVYALPCTSGCGICPPVYLRVYIASLCIPQGVHSLPVYTSGLYLRVYLSYLRFIPQSVPLIPQDVPLLFPFHCWARSLPSLLFPFHCWARKTLSSFPVSLLGKKTLLPPLPVSLLGKKDSSFSLSRFTVGQERLS